MIDAATLAAYEQHAAHYAQDWHEQPPPEDLYALLSAYFAPGPTADIGCGSGRDTAWLAVQGFDVIGYDASPALLAEARRRYPQLRFEAAELPALQGLAPASLRNIVCETVIMHLPAPAIAPAVRRLTELLVPGGTLYLSWRLTEGTDRRDERGRLYAAFDTRLVLDSLGDAAIAFDKTALSASSGKAIRRLVARRALA